MKKPFVPEIATSLALTLAEIRMLEQLRAVDERELGKLPAPLALAVREYLEAYRAVNGDGSAKR
jgi:hypothetical protein